MYILITESVRDALAENSGSTLQMTGSSCPASLGAELSLRQFFQSGCDNCIPVRHIFGPKRQATSASGSHTLARCGSAAVPPAWNAISGGLSWVATMTIRHKTFVAKGRLNKSFPQWSMRDAGCGDEPTMIRLLNKVW